MSLDAAPAKQAQPRKTGPAGQLVERVRRAFWPAKHLRPSDHVRWIESGGRRFGVVGPMPTRDPGLGQTVLWRKGNRPRIGRPFDREKVAPDFEIEVVLPWDEPGERGVVLEMTDAAGRPQCYRILMGGNSRVKPIDLGIAVPAGKVTVRPFFAAETGETRINFASQFEVTGGPPVIAAEAGIVLAKSDAYEAARAAFEDNLERLDYEGNWELRQQEIDEGRALMTAAPRHIQLQIGHVCNIDCIMCNTGRTPDHTALPEGVLRDLPNLLKFVDRVAIQGGEPLMYKSLRDHLAAAADHPRVIVSLGTNALLLRRGGWIEVIRRGRFVLQISLDAATPATYEHIRRKSSWSEVIGAIDEVNEKRSGLWPRFGVSFCVMRSNYKEIVDFVDLAHARRATWVYYNLMEPGDLEIGNKDENLHEDPRRWPPLRSGQAFSGRLRGVSSCDEQPHGPGASAEPPRGHCHLEHTSGATHLTSCFRFPGATLFVTEGVIGRGFRVTRRSRIRPANFISASPLSGRSR